MLQVFVSIALILGDGLYNFLKILYFTATNIHARAKRNLKTCKWVIYAMSLMCLVSCYVHREFNPKLTAQQYQKKYVKGLGCCN
jgi:hypothetical protein